MRHYLERLIKVRRPSVMMDSSILRDGILAGIERGTQAEHHDYSLLTDS